MVTLTGHASGTGGRFVLGVVFTFYLVLLAIGVSRHEPWFDELQAWLIARDATFRDLLGTVCRYEGSPPLWHLVLMPLARMGLPPVSANIVSAICAAAAVALVLRFSPLPLLLKVLAPFLYFPFYQYALVARNYGLTVLFLWAIAAVFPRRGDHPWLYRMLVGLLALTSIHGWFFAAALLFYHVLCRVRRNGRAAPLERSSPPGDAANLAAFGILTILLAVLLWTPPDHAFPNPLAPDSRLQPNPYRFFYLLTSLTDHLLLSAAVMAVSSYWFWRRGILALYLGGVMPLLLFFWLKYANAWHEGILFGWWFFCLWISLGGAADAAAGQPREVAVRGMMLVAAAVVFANHALWGLSAYLHDLRLPYSGLQASAAYLWARPDSGSQPFHSTGYTGVALNAFFERNAVANYQSKLGDHGYFLWSRNLVTMDPSPQADGPLWIVDTLKFDDDFAKPLPQGYQLEAVFPGVILWKDRWLEWEFVRVARKWQESATDQGQARPK